MADDRGVIKANWARLVSMSACPSDVWVSVISIRMVEYSRSDFWIELCIGNETVVNTRIYVVAMRRSANNWIESSFWMAPRTRPSFV